MGTVSTVDLVKRTVVDLLTTALASAGLDDGQIPVFYAWPGRNTPAECVYLGLFDEHRTDIEWDVAAITNGRQPYSEQYTFPVTVWSMRPDLDPSKAEECEQRAFTILDPIRDVFADDPTLGLSQIRWAKLTFEPGASNLHRFESGWACELAPVVEVQARLT